MKKIISVMTIAAACFSAGAYAETPAQDVSATVAISGVLVGPQNHACQIVLNKNVINLTGSTKSLIEQGQNATAPQEVTFSVYSVNQTYQSLCDKDIYDGKIAVRFTGVYDNADGTAFANSATGDSAAAGIGIGLFNHDKTPLDASEVYKLGTGANTATKIIGLQLIKLKGETATAGTVAGNITFQIERL